MIEDKSTWMHTMLFKPWDKSWTPYSAHTSSSVQSCIGPACSCRHVSLWLWVFSLFLCGPNVPNTLTQFMLHFYLSSTLNISFTHALLHFHFYDCFFLLPPLLLSHLCSINMRRRKCVCSAGCMHVCVCVWNCLFLHAWLTKVSVWVAVLCLWMEISVCMWILSDCYSHKAVMRLEAQSEKHKHRQPVFYLPLALH